MIVSDLATLSIVSEHRTARAISEVMGLEPTRSAERGEPTRSAVHGNTSPDRPATRAVASWSLDADEKAADPEDETGFRTLRLLLNQISTKTAQIAELKLDCDVSITWTGSSDSWQGGFVLDEDLLRDLGRLGIAIWGTVLLDDEAEEGDETEDEPADGWTRSRRGFAEAVEVALQLPNDGAGTPDAPPAR
ncbi:DUF4279 domain-containing protein [Curtobacterium sp. 9128]|uniref:DUF4279 domain-containing protein n=1 Tax=Curtobacterium sp. 9128 TaxID=1793722 RepID=UPI001643189A|nr:DUF4279 domain-containing protein [Curtobacterium sp. 9128]